MGLPPFYTLRYVEVSSPLLSSLWLIIGSAVVLYTLFGSLLCQHSYVERHTPLVDVGFWQDRSVDGSWWSTLPSEPSSYCGLAFRAVYSGNSSWGSNSIGCLRPENEQTQFFYTSPNEVRVAFSVADGGDPQYNTSNVNIYEGIEKSTLVFEVSFSTVHETVQHVPNCQAFGPRSESYPEGMPIRSRYEELLPGKDYGERYLMLSIEDILAASNKSIDDLGSEMAPLRLSGLEVVARVELQNFHIPLAWPLRWNPLGLHQASTLDCTVRFSVLRDMFNPIQWFYDGKKPVALQHGMRLSVVGTGSVGYPSSTVLLTQLLLGFTMFGFSQSILDLGWYYFHKDSVTIANKAYEPLNLDVPRLHEKAS